MKKSTLFMLAMLFLSIFAHAQADAIDTEAPVEAVKDTSYWTKGGSFSVNFNNTSLTNWAAGGKSSIALGTIVDLNANYLKGSDNWTNNLNWASGMSRVGGAQELIKKSDDQLILFSKYRRNMKPNWGFAGFAELRTQVLKNPVYAKDSTVIEGDGRKFEKKTDQYTSAFMSAGYLTTSIGWEYSKGKSFYIHATPLAGRGTFVLDDSLSALGGNGLEKNQKLLFQLGSLARVGFKTVVMENVNFSTNFMLFSPYKKYGNIDVTWETLTSFKINKFLSTTFATQLLYFDAARPKSVNEKVNGKDTQVKKHGVQFKHVLNIGFLAKF